MKNRKGKPKPVSLFFTPKETKALGMGLAVVLDQLQDVKKGEGSAIPWTAEARKILLDMEQSVRSAIDKLEKFAGVDCTLPEYKEGDENEFFTKES